MKGFYLDGDKDSIRFIIDSVSDYLFLHEIKDNGNVGKIIDVNKRVIEDYGYTYEEITNLYPYDLDTERPKEVLDNNTKKFMVNTRSPIFEVLHKTKSGELIPVELSISYISRNNKNLALVSGRSVKEKKVAQKELEEEHIFLKTVIESLSFPFMVIDAKTMRVLVTNSKARKLEGAYIDNGCSGILKDGKNICKSADCPVKKVLLSKKEEYSEAKIVADGVEKYYLIKAYPIFDNEGNVDKIIESFDDITTRKQTELELIKARDLALQAADEKDSFMKSITHELRTPLSSIIGYSDLLLSEESDQKKINKLENISVSADKLLSMVSKMLAFSRKYDKNEDFSFDNLFGKLREGITKQFKYSDFGSIKPQEGKDCEDEVYEKLIKLIRELKSNFKIFDSKEILAKIGDFDCKENPEIGKALNQIKQAAEDFDEDNFIHLVIELESKL